MHALASQHFILDMPPSALCSTQPHHRNSSSTTGANDEVGSLRSIAAIRQMSRGDSVGTTPIADIVTIGAELLDLAGRHAADGLAVEWVA